MMRWIFTLLAAFVLAAACSKPKEIFRVEQRKEEPIPGMTDLKVDLSDIDLGLVRGVRVVDPGGKVLAEAGNASAGAKIPFEHGGKRWNLCIESIDYHLTSADYAFFYVEPAE